jgi:hypothetical protein
MLEELADVYGTKFDYTLMWVLLPTPPRPRCDLAIKQTLDQ